MARIYIDVKFGSDSAGDGSSARPYATLFHVAPMIGHGDEVIINDSPGESQEEYVYSEPNTVELRDLTNVSIKFLVAPGWTNSRVVWKPATVNGTKASLYIENCADLRIEGATLMSTSTLVDHAYAIRAVNSSLTVSGCKIHSAWEVDDSPSGEMFSFEHCNARISSLVSDGYNNSYSNVSSFIAVSGNGDYEIYSCSLKNVTTNNGLYRGLWIKPETRSVIVDGILIHNIECDLVDMAIGIHIDSSETAPTNFTINGCQLSTIHIGMLATNIPIGSSTKVFKRSTFYKCRIAMKVVNSAISFYSISSYAGSPTISHEYPPGHTTSYGTYGVFADDYSNVSLVNTIVTSTGTALYSQNSSEIRVEHMVWHDCVALKSTSADGKILAIQFIRRVDPQYEDLYKLPWGFFLLADTSPCIDVGKKYGDLFLGLAPDIGALERSRKLRVGDLPALIARSVRYTERIPLTNIDIEGMIVRGLDTYDPEVKAGREGSAIRDLAVKPLTGLLAPYTTELESIRDQLSFANLENLDEDAADSLASNLFVTRKSGDVSTGVVRVYFEEPVITSIPAEVEFISQQGYRYYTIQEISLTAEEMSLNFENGLYYIDVLVEAEKVGAEYNIPEGSITRTTSPMPNGVVAILNPNSFSGGDNSETNEELKARIETAITVRDLVTKKGIHFVLPERFTFIDDIRAIGFRDPEMLRDEIFGYHIGGKVDIYVKTSNPAVSDRIIELAPAVIPINMGSFGNVPLLRINSIEVLDPLTQDSIGVTIPKNKWDLVSVNNHTRFSIHEQLELRLHKSFVGATIKVNYTWIPEIRALQDFLLNSSDRVVCADLFAKHFEPSFVSFHMTYYGPAAIPGLDSLLRSFIYTMKSGAALQASDIIDYVHTLGSVHVNNPFMLRAETHTMYGELHVQESEDEVDVGRISAFLPDAITVEYMGPDPRD